jgi:hypothetical protein
LASNLLSFHSNDRRCSILLPPTFSGGGESEDFCHKKIHAQKIPETIKSMGAHSALVNNMGIRGLKRIAVTINKTAHICFIKFIEQNTI